ncbi:MAG: hypothetical protein ACRDTM_15300, partial [Micromonosporaceae bacterium]
MYEPPAPDARSQWLPAEPDGSPAAVWPPTQLWAGAARPDAVPSEHPSAGRGQLSEHFWRRVEVGQPGGEEAEPGGPAPARSAPGSVAAPGSAAQHGSAQGVSAEEPDEVPEHGNVVRLLGGRSGGHRRVGLAREPERWSQPVNSSRAPRAAPPQIAPRQAPGHPEA